MTMMTPAHEAMFATLDRLHYRRILSDDDLREAGELRRRAFDSKEIYTEKFGDAVVEPIDRLPDTYNFGLYTDSQMIATVRLNVISTKAPDAPACRTFPAVLNPLVQQGMTFIDPSRLAVDPDFADVVPALPILVLRPALIATTHFLADQCLAVVRVHHEPFYRRVFRSTRIGGPIDPGNTFAQLVLLGSVRENTARIQQRYPIFHFTEEEQHALFAENPLSRIMPSAAEAAGVDVTALSVDPLSSVA